MICFATNELKHVHIIRTLPPFSLDSIHAMVYYKERKWNEYIYLTYISMLKIHG